MIAESIALILRPIIAAELLKSRVSPRVKKQFPESESLMSIDRKGDRARCFRGSGRYRRYSIKLNN
eukprot:8114428-Pyramimonas_sp.AAC.1